MKRLLSSIKSLLNEGKQEAVLFLGTAEKTADVETRAEPGAGERNGLFTLVSGRVQGILLRERIGCSPLPLNVYPTPARNALCGGKLAAGGFHSTANTGRTPFIFQLTWLSWAFPLNNLRGLTQQRRREEFQHVRDPGG
jgi:hypothetical protein